MDAAGYVFGWDLVPDVVAVADALAVSGVGVGAGAEYVSVAPLCYCEAW